MTELIDFENSQVSALQFLSKQDFEKGVELLHSRQQPFEVIGFDTLIVPSEGIEGARKILRAAGVSVNRLPVTSTAELNQAQRATLRRELRGQGSTGSQAELKLKQRKAS